MAQAYHGYNYKLTSPDIFYNILKLVTQFDSLTRSWSMQHIYNYLLYRMFLVECANSQLQLEYPKKRVKTNKSLVEGVGLRDETK